MKVKCPKCSYEWETKTKLDFVTCPNCQRKFKKIKLYSIYLDVEMVKKIKFKCYNKEITMSGYIRKLIEKDLKKTEILKQ